VNGNPTRRDFVAATAAGVAGLFAGQAVAAPSSGAAPSSDNGLRVCFFTDSHLPYADTLARLPNAKFHHQERIQTAFDKANGFQPKAFVFGGDNVFAVDQSNDGGDKEDNARAQFDNWKRVVADKVRVPHHSVIGNHDIWHARPKGQDAKALAIAGYGMPNRYYSWSMKGWKFLMLDVFHDSGCHVDKEQLTWLENELAGDRPVCVVTHSPILGVTSQLVGGGVGGAKEFSELFYRHPNVRLALSGHQHMVDCCQIDRVTYHCAGAVSGSWWEGSYQHFPPAFLILDLLSNGDSRHEMVFWEKA
jgi:Icc protein